jgi:hypothetical protein
MEIGEVTFDPNGTVAKKTGLAGALYDFSVDVGAPDRPVSYGPFVDGKLLCAMKIYGSLRR